METSDSEMLVDGKLLSYEVSTIEYGKASTLSHFPMFILHQTFRCSLLAYFVVFFKNGFTTGDLMTAQKTGRIQPPAWCGIPSA